MMTFDPRSLLRLEELVKPRRPKELRAWVLETCRHIADVPEAKEPALLHVRPFKEFYEEIFPLSLFAVRRYGDRDDLVCVPSCNERLDFDAEVREPAGTVKVEITLARDPHLHLRMEYFLQHRNVNVFVEVTVRGRGKREREITVANEAVDLSEVRTRHLGWVKLAAEGKAGRGRYGVGYELVIAVEDSWFDADEDAAAVAEFVARDVLTLPLSFEAVHLVGLTDQLYRSFAISQHDSSAQ